MSNFNKIEPEKFSNQENNLTLSKESLTAVIFIENELEERIFLQSKIVRKTEKELILVSKSFVPKYLKKGFVMTEAKTFEEAINDIFPNINTEWFIYLKPEENFNDFVIQIEQKANSYYVNIITVINEKVRQADLINSEKRLFNVNYKFEETEARCKAQIINYRKLINVLEKTELEIANTKYINRDRSLKTILYLLQRGLIKISFDNLLDFLKDEYKNPPEQILDLNLFIARTYMNQKKFESAKSLLLKTIKEYNDSPDLNSLLSEIYFMEKDFIQAEKYIIKCLELGKNNSFYKFLPFRLAIVNFAASYFLGKIYFEKNEFEKSVKAFEDCLISQPDFKQAQIDLEEVRQKLNKTSGAINELDFACQACGNCCRMFEASLITHRDIITILENRPDLKVEDFVNFAIVKAKPGEEQKKYLCLKKKNNSSDCIFLTKDSLCEINAFKPLACKTWPFNINSNKDISWGNRNREFIKKYCSHKMQKGSNDETELMNNLIRLDQDILELENLTKKMAFTNPRFHQLINNVNGEFIEVIKEMIQTETDKY